MGLPDSVTTNNLCDHLEIDFATYNDPIDRSTIQLQEKWLISRATRLKSDTGDWFILTMMLWNLSAIAIEQNREKTSEKSLECLSHFFHTMHSSAKRLQHFFFHRFRNTASDWFLLMNVTIYVQLLYEQGWVPKFIGKKVLQVATF